MGTCSACGKQIEFGYQAESGALICVDCNLKMQQANEIGRRSLERMINYLTGEMEAVSGVSLGWPRFPEPKPPVHMHNPTLNTVQISDSVVGAVNQGYVEGMNVTLSHINKKSTKEAELIKMFSELLLKTQEISKEEKEAILQHLNYLAGQLNVSKERRPVQVLKEIISIISTAVQAVPILKAFWDKLSGIFI